VSLLRENEKRMKKFTVKGLSLINVSEVNLTGKFVTLLNKRCAPA
jgi:hypothetical protein